MSRYIDADDFFRQFSELDIEPYNNAPTIEIEPNDCVLKEFGKCSYKETGCSDCYLKERIRRALDEKCYEIGHADGARLGYEKGLNDARPKGEWLDVKPVYPYPFKCSVCGHMHSYKPRYCSACGSLNNEDISLER